MQDLQKQPTSVLFGHVRSYISEAERVIGRKYTSDVSECMMRLEQARQKCELLKAGWEKLHFTERTKIEAGVRAALFEIFDDCVNTVAEAERKK